MRQHRRVITDGLSFERGIGCQRKKSSSQSSVRVKTFHKITGACEKGEVYSRGGEGAHPLSRDENLADFLNSGPSSILTLSSPCFYLFFSFLIVCWQIHSAHEQTTLPRTRPRVVPRRGTLTRKLKKETKQKTNKEKTEVTNVEIELHTHTHVCAKERQRQIYEIKSSRQKNRLLTRVKRPWVSPPAISSSLTQLELCGWKGWNDLVLHTVPFTYISD